MHVSGGRPYLYIILKILLYYSISDNSQKFTHKNSWYFHFGGKENIYDSMSVGIDPDCTPNKYSRRISIYINGSVVEFEQSLE